MTRRTRLQFEALEGRWLPSFSPVVSYPVGAGPQAIVSADFNNDGRLDLATTNAGANTVSVLLGGPGGFDPAIHSNADSQPIGVVAADFNNDGNIDLATVNDPWGARLLLGNGDGSFAAPVWPDLIPLSVRAMAAADMNADGNSDLVYIASDPDLGDYVEVLLGNGRGGFTYGDWESISTYPNDFTTLTVADLTGDGRPDVVAVSELFALVTVLRNDGQGNLSGTGTFETGNNTRGVAAADFTGDGIADLAAAGYTRVGILPGNGDGTFGSPIVEMTNNSQQTSVATADFNGDGRADLVAPDSGEGVLTALLGLGNGMLSLVGDHSVGSGPAAVAVGDFNGDGRPDAATANAGSNTVSVLLNDGVWPDVSVPQLLVGDATVIEGHAGSGAAIFTVTLSAASNKTITVFYATGNGTATAGSDYQAVSGTLTFAPGETSKTITVLVNGDRLAEANETFVITLSSPTNATIADAQGAGAILDDEPRISISDVAKKEGKKNQKTLFVFTVTLSAAYDQAVTMSFQTVNGTATTGDGDYIAKTGTLTFAPGETTKTITIEVKGDSKREGNETFYLDLFGNTDGSVFTKNRGVGTILNDD